MHYVVYTYINPPPHTHTEKSKGIIKPQNQHTGLVSH